MQSAAGLSERLANYLTGAIFVLVPFHAFLTVWGSTFFGHFFLLRLWDELLLALLCIVVGVMLWSDRTLLKKLISNRLAQLIGAYIAIEVVWGVAAYAFHQVTLLALLYGLVVNLRFLVWFLAVWVVAQQSDWLRSHWKPLILWPLAIVVAFGLLQFFVWPPTILTHFGYGPNTYAPYITLNQDSSIVRIQSTLRGANGLAAYLAVAVALLASIGAAARKSWRIWLLSLGAVVTLIVTFSRSGWIAAAIGVAIVVCVRLRSGLRRRATLLLVAGMLAATVLGALALKTNTDAQDLFYHVSDHTTATQTSNGQHAIAFSESLSDIIHEPLGRGPGSSGQESWYNTGHRGRNTESLLLQIGEETGWLGLGVFMAILIQLGRGLWSRRSKPLALAMLASLIGITLISLVTYSWIDDTLAFIWWGLAAIAYARNSRNTMV